jgi:hypothetical protein
MAGIGLGLLLSRSIKPPSQPSQAFASLGTSTKEEYIALVAAAYALDHDLEKAQASLDLLEAPNINAWIANLTGRVFAEGREPADIQALMELAHGLGVQSQPVLAYMATLSPVPTDTPVPTLTLAPTRTPTAPPTQPTEEPTAVPSTSTPQPTDTPMRPTPTPAPSETPIPPASNTPRPQPSNTSKPQPTPTVPEPTVQPTHTPAAKWAWAARLVGPGHEGQTCSDGLKLIRVTVLDAAGNQIPGVWVYEQYTSQYQVSGHKGEDPFWGPGEAEFSGLDGGQMCIATGEGGACESDLTRNLPCHDPPTFEDLWAAGYCECCEPDITPERCRELFDSGKCLGISHYAWRVEFKRSW